MNENGEYTNSKGDPPRNGTLYAVLELAKNGEIFDFLASTGKFPEPIARFYFKQMLGALYYMNTQGFCHRDLKPENLFLDEEYNLKIADFGFATALCGKEGLGKLQTILGTESYMAPEFRIKKKNGYHGIPIDLFSSAVILFIFVTGAPCFKMACTKDINYSLICKNKHNEFWKAFIHRKKMKLDSKFIDLMNSMLAFDPINRPTIPEIMCSPWVNGATATHAEVKEYFGSMKITDDEYQEAERLAKDKLKNLKKEKKQENMNCVKNNNIKFATRGPGDDEDKMLREIKIKAEINKLDFDNIKFPTVDLDKLRQNTIVSGVDARAFCNYCMNVCEE